jgi:hypothetical protein
MRRNPILKWRLVLWPERVVRVLVGVLIGLAVFAAAKAISTYHKDESLKAKNELIEEGERSPERVNEE